MTFTLTRPVWTRSQVEQALWRYSVTYAHWGSDPNKLVGKLPQVFRSRIKKLLNLDRTPEMMSWTQLQDTWAFYDQPPQGTGSEERFSTVHVFVLGIALDLLNLGLKQSEVVFFVKSSRQNLEGALLEIHEAPGRIAPVMGAPRLISHQTYPDSTPISLENRSQAAADFTAWILMQRFETTEIYPLFEEKTKGRDIPLFIEPKFFFGLEAVKEELFRRRSKYRQVVLVELADLALTLPRFLAEAPSRRRGRPVVSGRAKK